MISIKSRFVLLILSVIILTSCKKLTEFTVSDSATFTISTATSVGVPIEQTMPVATSSNAEFSANGADIKNIKDVRLNKLVLNIINPPSETFSFLNSIHIFIKADNLPEAEIAYLEDISSSVGNKIELIATGVVLDEYIKKENYTLRIKTTTDEIITQDIEIRSDMSFRVRAKVL